MPYSISEVEALRIRAFFGSHVPSYVGESVQIVDVIYIAQLTDREYSAIEKAAPKRQREFATGRYAARRALAQIRSPRAEVLVNPDRSPQWPSSFIGSISHSDMIAAAVVGNSDKVLSIGIDVERISTAKEEIWSIIFRPDEIYALQKLSLDEQSTVATVAFSAKETFFKFQFPLTRQWLEFNRVTVKIISKRRFKIEVHDNVVASLLKNNMLVGHYDVTQHHVITSLIVGKSYLDSGYY